MRSRRSALLEPLAVLTLLAAAAAIASMALGAVSIAPLRVVEVPWSMITPHAAPVAGMEATILADIRLPRTLLALLIGTALAVSGAFLQGLFRNPLADPGLAGVSAGAALAATTLIVLGDRLLPGFDAFVPILLPAAAFVGGLATTVILYALATRRARTRSPSCCWPASRSARLPVRRPGC